jgi:hypothetical protein
MYGSSKSGVKTGLAARGSRLPESLRREENLVVWGNDGEFGKLR